MLGLGLGITKTAGLRSLAQKLLSILRGRATYYENGAASKEEIQTIYDYELLDKATILLTPTATSDALVHSVKTYTGNELVINGTFDTNNDWNLGSGDWTISGGSASTTNGNNNLHTSNPVVPATGLRYKVTFTLQNVSQGYVRVGLSSLTSTQFNSDGTYTIYIESDGNRYLYFKPYGFTGSIDNVSVVDVSSDFDFDRASSATRINSSGLLQDMQSITDPELVTDGDFSNGLSDWTTNTATESGGVVTIPNNGYIFQTITLPDSGKLKIKVEGSGTVKYRLGVSSPSDTFITKTLPFTAYEDLNSADVRIQLNNTSGSDITVTSVSLKDVTFGTDVDLARINYDNNGENGHILLEPTRTNDANYSQNATEWIWGKDSNPNSTTRVDGQVDPFGGTEASQFTRDAGTGGWFANANNTTGSAAYYTHSIFVKQPTSNASTTINMKNVSVSPNAQVTFTFSSESFTTESSATGSFEKLANGYYRLSMIFYNGAASSAQVRHTLDDGKALIVFGIQHEEGSYPTSYIPNLTTGQTTRAVETLLGSGNSTLISSTEGSLYVDTAALNSSPGTQITISLSGDNANDRILIYANSGGGKWLAQFRKNSSSYVTIDKSATISNQSKVALAWESGRYVMFVDGVKATTYDTGSETESTTFDAGDLKSLQFSPNKGATGNYYYGKVKAIAVFNEALENDELELLTGVTNYGSFGELASANGYTII